MKRQVFPIVGTLITKRSSGAFVRITSCRSSRVRLCHIIQLNCEVAALGLAFLLTSLCLFKNIALAIFIFNCVGRAQGSLTSD